MTRYVYVEDQIAVPKLDLAKGATFHELFSCDRVADAHLPHHWRGLHGRVIGLISMVVDGRLKVWTAHVIFWIEMGLGAMKTAVYGVSRLCVELGIIVVVLVVIDVYWWIVWNESLLRRLAVRIVVPCVGHGNEGEKERGKQSPLDDDDEGVYSDILATRIIYTRSITIV